MTRQSRIVALAAVLLLAGCAKTAANPCVVADGAMTRFVVTITGGKGAHRFSVEQAKTAAEQQQGLMFRTDIAPDAGMLFWPYPPSGPPREASFWMKNTPSPLDIVFIRANGTIARIAENTTPYSEEPIPSGEPVGAVLEIKGGRALELGIDEGDTVTWPKTCGSETVK